MSEQFAKTGIYMRLSRDDEKSGESASIENQRIILKRYVQERGGTVTEEYVDDGWSGTNFDRPAVRKMLADARNRIIDTIVVKDLSRFGRNYIQVGQYVDYIFPAYGIRFIAISDNVDTAERNSTAMDMMPIMNVFNEWHAANTSKKIRAVLEANQRSGKYTNWSYPFGYKAGVDEFRTAEIDEEAAQVVKRIFNLRVQGYSSRAIAKILTDEGIPNPATYYTKIDGGKQNRRCLPYWCPSTVTRILNDKTYLGSTIQHKTTSVSYKNHKTVNLPESQHIIKENSHQAIIDRGLWDKVQAINKGFSGGKTDKTNTVHALSGFLICADCGKKLKLKSSKNGNSFMCRTYVDLGKKYCTSHAVSESEIEDVILNDIRSMLSFTAIDEEREKQRFLQKKQSGNSYEKRLKTLKSRLAELDKLIQYAFEQKVLNGMQEALYDSLCEKYQKERLDVEKEILSLQNKLVDEDAERYLQKLKAYCNCDKLTREICLQLIKFITVGEKDANGRSIHIYYNFSQT